MMSSEAHRVWFTPSIVVALLLALGAVWCARILAHSGVEAMRIKHGEQRVVVTGSATKRIRSDFVVWRARVHSQAPDLGQASKKLATDVPVVVAFIKGRGISPNDMKVSATSVRELHPRDKEGHEQLETTVAYVTEQVVEVSSSDIGKVERVSREATQLIDQGVYVLSDDPLYIYTRLAELKIQMLADAAKDARSRAEQVATQTGSRLGHLITARMGVMQINPAYSTEVSAEGNNDKTSLDKDALAIVAATFALQ